MLLFSKRTTCAVTVFACLSAARSAQKLTKVQTQVDMLDLQHVALFQVYRRVLHQDQANQAEVLDAVIALATTAIGNLNATVQGIAPTPSTAFPLSEIQIVVANAVQALASVTS